MWPKLLTVCLSSFVSLSQEKQISQRARGQQELAVSSLNGMNQEAKHCVDMWLKMPGKFRIWIRELLDHCSSDDLLSSQGWRKDDHVLKDLGMPKTDHLFMSATAFYSLPVPFYLGLGPGAGFERRRRRRPASSPVNRSTRHTCPVINCGRVYDNASLLEGHLKR